MWPFESSWQTRLSKLFVWIEILLKKVQRTKCDPWTHGPNNKNNNNNNYMNLLLKFCSKKCDTERVILWVQLTDQTIVWPSWQTKPPLVYMNQNFAQKSATWKVWPLVYYELKFCYKSATRIVWPLVLYELKFCSKKCDMKCVTLGFIWKLCGEDVWLS